VITFPASAGISQPGVPGRAFSRCTGFAAVEKVAGIVEDVLLPLVPPQAVRTAIRTTACAAIATGAP
jgi:hypothetical protein